MDWVTALIPSKDIRYANEDLYNEMLKRDQEQYQKEKEKHQHMHEHIEDVDQQLCEEDANGEWHVDEEGNGSCDWIKPIDDSEFFDGGDD